MGHLKLLLLFVAYTTACNQDLTEPSGEFTTPNYPNDYPSDTQCIFKISVPQGPIYLEFLDFELESEMNCDYDYVEVFDGYDRIGRFCGSNIPGPFLSNTDLMAVNFVSDVVINFRGFRAIYRVDDIPTWIPTRPPTPPPTTPPLGCVRTIVGNSGWISSPNYPGNYDNNLDCAWTIQLETSGGRMALQFLDFELEASSTCVYDYVEVYDGASTGAPRLGRFCGTNAETVYTTGDTMYVVFSTDFSITERGFNATWAVLSCEFLGGNCDVTCPEGEFEGVDCGEGLRCCKPRLYPEDCGSPEVRESFIVGGEDAVPGAWPWQASLQTGNSHFCGGSLLNQQWVVTAAICVQGMTGADVVLGASDIGNLTGNELRVRADTIILHPDFSNASPYPNDVALLKLNQQVTFSPTVKAVCMPRVNDTFDHNDNCFATGWGDTMGSQDPNKLQALSIAPIPLSECQARWGSTPVLDSNICAGNGNSGTCRGDVGGPFACQMEDQRWYLAGSASWGVACQPDPLPDVFTRVAAYRDWIDNTILSGKK